MKNILEFIQALAFISAFCSATSCKKHQNSISEIKVSNSDVALRASMPAATKVADHLYADIAVANQSQDSIHITLLNNEPELKIKLKDRSGKDVPYTAEGRMKIVRPGVQKMAFVPIAPGDSRKWKVNLAELFELPAGEYNLTLRVPINVLAKPPDPGPFFLSGSTKILRVK